MKFLRLAYLLDFIAVDSLGKMVMTSLQNFMDMLYGGKYEHNESLRRTSIDVIKNNTLSDL